MKQIKTTTLFAIFAIANVYSAFAQTPPVTQTVIYNGGGVIVNSGNRDVPISRADRTTEPQSLCQQLKNAGKTLAQALCDIRNGGIYTASETLKAAMAVYSSSEVTVIYQMKTCWTADQIAVGLKRAYNYTANQIAAKLRAAGYNALEVMQAIDRGIAAGFDVALAALTSAGYTVRDIAAILNNNTYTFNAQYSLTQIGNFLKTNGFTPTQMADAFKNVLNRGGQAIVNALKELNFTANQIGEAIKVNFNASFETIAGYLRAAEFGKRRIIEMGVHTFNVSANLAATVLKNLGYSANSIAEALAQGMNANATAIVTALKELGYNPGETVIAVKAAIDNANAVALAIKNVLGKSAGDAALLMAQAGYGVSVITSAIAGAFNLAANVVTGILNAVGIR